MQFRSKLNGEIMFKILLILLCIFSTITSFSATKKRKCKKNYSRISCTDLKEAKRNSFCFKGKITDSKRLKICKKTPKKRIKRNKIKAVKAKVKNTKGHRSNVVNSKPEKKTKITKKVKATETEIEPLESTKPELQEDTTSPLKNSTKEQDNENGDSSNKS
jgi:hypothetical protein